MRHRRKPEPDVPVRNEPVPDVVTEKPDTHHTKQITYITHTLMTVGVIVVIAISYTVVMSIVRKPGEASSSNRTVSGPEYQVVIPSGKSVENLGGWKRVSPPENDPVYAYEDVIDGVGISVSQQPLPESFMGKINDRVAELAKKFNATDKIDADGITVYTGTSAKGPQSVILTKNHLLILIKSQKKISDASWIAYVKSLSTINPDQLPKY